MLNVKMVYLAKRANIEYHESLVNSRKGHRLTKEEIDYANAEIKRRIKNGQSLDAIVKTDDNIKNAHLLIIIIQMMVFLN